MRRLSFVSRKRPLAQRRTFFFGKKESSGSQQQGGSEPGKQTPDTGAFPPGMPDPTKLQEFMKASPEKQIELMRKAVEFQKTIGRVPGLGKLASKNAEMMERVINTAERQIKGGPPPTPQETAKLQEDFQQFVSSSSKLPLQPTANTASSSAPAASAVSSQSAPRVKAPTLDELSKINLGAEIEALFAELRSLRESKNSYRDKFHAREKELAQLQSETARAKEAESNIREKLQRAEKDVVLLNSEAIELKERLRELKDLKALVPALQQQVAQLSGTDVQAQSEIIQGLKVEVKSKTDALRALNRKLERARKHDPLLQFSVSCCSEPLRLCGDTDLSPVVEEAFQALRETFECEKQSAWKRSVSENHAGAKILVGVARQVFSHLPFAALDASVNTDGGDMDALQKHLAAVGFSVVMDAVVQGKLHVTASGSSSGGHTNWRPDANGGVGPYGYLCALQLLQTGGSRLPSLKPLPYRVASVAPFVSEALTSDPARAQVEYETSRSAGPGGQAANVSETQIVAKLLIDGKHLFQAEAQDSRSALANKESALTKLKTTRRHLWNEQALKFNAAQMRMELMQRAEGSARHSNGDDGGAAAEPDERLELLRAAVADSAVREMDGVLVSAMLDLLPVS